MTAVPMFHVLGLGMAIHVPFSAGASACLILKFNTKEAINQMKRGNANVIIGVPALYNALLSRDKFYGPHLKKQIVAYLGGDYCPMSLIERWNGAMEKYGSKARLFVGYGLTETSTACNVNTFGGRNKYGSVGKPLPGVLNKIIDPDTGEELPAGKYGEILVGGPSLMTGYFDDEKLNEKTLFKDKDGNQWLHTMDYGCMDEDGYLYFKQRLRRIVKVNAETLCPSDVEEVVNSLPGIYESYCYCVPNARKGNIFRLLAVIRRGDHPLSEEEAEKAIKEAVKKSLPPAYFPDKIIFMKKLPRTPLGKIDISSIEGAETH
jgi:long-chain acyl-CoA synthetase